MRTGPAGAIAPEQPVHSPRVSPCPGVTLERPGAAFLAVPPGVGAADGQWPKRPVVVAGRSPRSHQSACHGDGVSTTRMPTGVGLARIRPGRGVCKAHLSVRPVMRTSRCDAVPAIPTPAGLGPGVPRQFSPWHVPLLPAATSASWCCTPTRMASRPMATDDSCTPPTRA
jgi:hypothetical protein